MSPFRTEFDRRENGVRSTQNTRNQRAENKADEGGFGLQNAGFALEALATGGSEC